MESDPDFNWRPLDASSGDSAPAEPKPPAPASPAAPASQQGRPGADRALAPEHARGAVSLAEPPPPPGGYGDFDVDDVPAPKGRGPASTRYIGIGILVALAFVGGVSMQKRHDAGYSPPAKGLAALAGAGGAGAAAGRGAGAGAAGAAGGAAAGAGAGRTPALVGTVVKINGTDLTVRDANGAEHQVHANETTRVSRQESLSDIDQGTNVSIAGTPDQSGAIDAVAITQHPGSAAPTTPPNGASGNNSTGPGTGDTGPGSITSGTAGNPAAPQSRGTTTNSGAGPAAGSASTTGNAAVPAKQ